MNIAQRFTAVRQHFATATPGRRTLYGVVAVAVMIAIYSIFSSGTEAVNEVSEVTRINGGEEMAAGNPAASGDTWIWLLVALFGIGVVAIVTGRGVSAGEKIVMLCVWILLIYFSPKILGGMFPQLVDGITFDNSDNSTSSEAVNTEWKGYTDITLAPGEVEKVEKKGRCNIDNLPTGEKDVQYEWDGTSTLTYTNKGTSERKVRINHYSPPEEDCRIASRRLLSEGKFM